MDDSNFFLVTSNKSKKFLVYAETKEEAKNIIETIKDPIVMTTPNGSMIPSNPTAIAENIKVDSFEQKGQYVSISFEGVQYHFSFEGDARRYGNCDCNGCKFKE